MDQYNYNGYTMRFKDGRLIISKFDGGHFHEIVFNKEMKKWLFMNLIGEYIGS